MKLLERLGVVKSPDRTFVPTLNELDAAAKKIIRTTSLNTATRSKLLFFAGKTEDHQEKFSTQINRKYDLVEVVVNGDPKNIALTIGIGQKDASLLYIRSYTAIPETLILRITQLSSIPDKDTLSSALTSLISGEGNFTETKFDLHKDGRSLQQMVDARQKS